MDERSHGVLRVVGELDDLVIALRFLIRTCEKRGFHNETHAMELALELLLRRRNYILNVTSALGKGPSHDSFPCENCYITYPTLFLMAWLEYVLNFCKDSEGVGSANTGVPLGSFLCRRSCTIHFGTSVQTDHLVEGVLYPMGVPYVSGPKQEPPRSAMDLVTGRLPGEFDEIRYVRETAELVLKKLRDDDTADSNLAGIVIGLLHARRDLGFDMDCVIDADVNRYRDLLSAELRTRDTKLLSHV